MSNGKWFATADPHYGHGNILKYCKRTQFMTPEEVKLLESGDQNFRVSKDSVGRMDRHMIEQTNQTVGEDDELWILGDWCFPSHYRKASYLRSQILCKNVYFVFGNHDKAEIVQAFDRPTLPELWDNPYLHKVEFYLDGILVSMEHYAPAIWNKSHRQAIGLYGHSHSGAEEMMNEKFPNRRSMDVGVDNAFKLLGEYRPFSWEEIKGFMAKKEGEVIDHHGADRKKGRKATR